MGLLPSRVFVDAEPEEPRVLDIDGTDADEAFEALSSTTARRILKAVYEEPRTPTEIRGEVGTSLQNVHYHLDKLETADLIEPAGTGYSEKGNEMTVFAPKSEAVVLFAGQQDDRSRLERVLGRVFGLFVVLSVLSATLSVVLDWLRPDPVSVTLTSKGGGGGVETGSAGVVETAASLDPAVAFFLGGSTMLLVLAGYWYVTEVR